MKENAGERLFRAMGDLPQELIEEAEQDELEEIRQEPEIEKENLPKQHRILQFLGRGAKYVPVAACFAMVFSGVWFFVGNMRMGSSAPFSLNIKDTQDMSGSAEAIEEELAEDADFDDAAETTMDAGAIQKPACYDSYIGPVLPMTVTGDNQNLKSARKLVFSVSKDPYADEPVPLLDIEDIYRIWNVSEEEKTIQLVYPFVANLNRAYELEAEVLEAEEQKISVSYAIGAGINRYLGRDIGTVSSWKDYEQLFTDPDGTYLEKALDKAEEWDRLVSVYTISENEADDEAAGNAVIGLRVSGQDTEVLTYGFDYEERTEDGQIQESFFADNPMERYLILAGEQQEEPELGYYSNLDWEEPVEGLEYNIHKQVMTYSEALRLCSRQAYRRLALEYEQGRYAGELPPYLDEAAAYEILTMGGQQEDFYQELMQSYHTGDIWRAYHIMLGETRVVYALATVTIPAKTAVRVSAHTQKRQMELYYEMAGTDMLEEAAAPDGTDTSSLTGSYDIFAKMGSRLNLGKVSMQLSMEEAFELKESDIGLKQKQDIWRGRIYEEVSHFQVDAE